MTRLPVVFLFFISETQNYLGYSKTFTKPSVTRPEELHEAVYNLGGNSKVAVESTIVWNLKDTIPKAFHLNSSTHNFWYILSELFVERTSYNVQTQQKKTPPSKKLSTRLPVFSLHVRNFSYHLAGTRNTLMYIIWSMLCKNWYWCNRAAALSQ